LEQYRDASFQQLLHSVGIDELLSAIYYGSKLEGPQDSLVFCTSFFAINQDPSAPDFF
jgi:hypothetical protein